MFLPHFDVLCDLFTEQTIYWTDFSFFFKIFLNLLLKNRPLPTLANTKKSHLTYSVVYTKWSNLIGCYAVTRNCDWLRKITPLSNLTQIAPRVMRTYSKSRIELRKENAVKINSVFVIRAALWAEKLKEGYRRWKFVSSVVSDSQISLTWYQRHLMAAIQLATSCGEL